MKTLFVLASFALFFVQTFSQDLPPLEQTTVELKPFNAIHDCLPFNLKIEPSSRGVYELTIEGEAPLMDAINATVKYGVLSLGLSSGFNTSRVIRVSVHMPVDALETLLSASTSSVVLAPGFTLKTLTVSVSGTASVYGFNLEVEDLIVEGSDSSTVFIRGKIALARVDVSGTSKMYIYGVEENVEVHAEGIGQVFLVVENNDVEITGHTSALGRVYTTGGYCALPITFFSRGCVGIRQNSLPLFSARYSCGLIVDGSLKCGIGKRDVPSYTSTAIDGWVTSTFASDSDTGRVTRGATTYASSRAGSFSTITTSSSSSMYSNINGNQFESIVQTKGLDGVVAVAATRCIDEDLDMFEL
eukprot:g6553.t1